MHSMFSCMLRSTASWELAQPRRLEAVAIDGRVAFWASQGATIALGFHYSITPTGQDQMVSANECKKQL